MSDQDKEEIKQIIKEEFEKRWIPLYMGTCQHEYLIDFNFPGNRICKKCGMAEVYYQMRETISKT